MAYTWEQLVEEYEQHKDMSENYDEDMDEADRKWWKRLQALNTDVNDLLDFGPRANVEWIHENDWIDHVKSEAELFEWIDVNSPVYYFINWEELGDQHIAPHYDEITFDGDNYYFKDNS